MSFDEKPRKFINLIINTKQKQTKNSLKHVYVHFNENICFFIGNIRILLYVLLSLRDNYYNICFFFEFNHSTRSHKVRKLQQMHEYYFFM